MGAACSGQRDHIPLGSSSCPFKILLLGKSGVGKTLLLYSWLHGLENLQDPIEPTSHFNVGLISSMSGRMFLVYDLAGNIGHRLRPFLNGTNGVLYLIKGAETMSADEASDLHELFQHQDLKSVPFLIVTKDDSADGLSEKLQVLLPERNWRVMASTLGNQEDVEQILLALDSLFTISSFKDS